MKMSSIYIYIKNIFFRSRLLTQKNHINAMAKKKFNKRFNLKILIIFPGKENRPIIIYHRIT